MQQEIQRQYDLLQQNMQQLLEELAPYSPQQLNQQPAPDAWSPIQIMHHLMLSERYSIAYCEKKLSFQPTLKKAGLLSGFRAKFVGWYLASPLKFKAPSFISGDNLPKEDTLENVKKAWTEQREAMRQFLENLPVEYADKEVYKHPFGGRLSLAGMLHFFNSHLQTHRKQIFRDLK